MLQCPLSSESERGVLREQGEHQRLRSLRHLGLPWSWFGEAPAVAHPGEEAKGRARPQRTVCRAFVMILGTVGFLRAKPV
eukprot:scaffold198445_cov27-Tisochrysis_lutea.AAC.4